MAPRSVIIENIINIINAVDDKTLREIERWVIGWLNMKRKIAVRREV